MFLATANLGLFYAIRQPPLVPDALLSLDVEAPADLKPKRNRSYFMWEYGKAPEAVIEIVSNKEGGETTDKMLKYAQIGILYYAIYDPFQKVQEEPLRVFVLRDKSYVPCAAEWLPVLNLGLTLWHGQFENTEDVWLRWCDREGDVIPTGAERAEQADQRAEQERQRAEQERQRAEQAGQRAEQERQRAEQERQRPNRNDNWLSRNGNGRTGWLPSCGTWASVPRKRKLVPFSFGLSRSHRVEARRSLSRCGDNWCRVRLFPVK